GSARRAPRRRRSSSDCSPDDPGRGARLARRPAPAPAARDAARAPGRRRHGFGAAVTPPPGAPRAAAPGPGDGAVAGGSPPDGRRGAQPVARAIRVATRELPLALFPGSALQLTDQVDLVLFLSLVSGRTPQYLIEEQVRAVPFLARHPVPTLSTGYILID